jgi:hypothetical protein
VAVAGEGAGQLCDGSADDRAAAALQGPGAECFGDQGAVTLMLWRVHLQDGPAHDLPHGHRVAGRGEPHAVGEHLLGTFMADNGKQGREFWCLFIQPALAGPCREVNLHNWAARPDFRQHRVGVLDIPSQLGELPHRIVAGLGRFFAPRRHDHACPPPGT